MSSTDSKPRVPRWVRAVLGLACTVLGVVLVTRPFTSLSVLVLLVGVSSIAVGVTQWSAARRTTGRIDDLVAVGFVALGVAIIVWPDLTLSNLAWLVGIAMVVSGVLGVVAGVRGTTDERVAAVLKGAASIVFGVLALAWPDVTVLVVAVVFGARTVLFGLSELFAAIRGREPADDVAPARRSFVRRSTATIGAAVALVVALALAGVSSTLHEGAPTVSEFYDSPDEVPTEPGALLRSEPYTRGMPDGSTAWRILYTTTRDDGVPAVASALVIAPSEPSDEPRPVIAWTHGTTGVDRTCAPSLQDDPLGSGAMYVADQVLDQGWVMVATDYIGLGSEGAHPYLIGQGEGRSALDAVRAAKQLTELSLDDRTVVWGHSQGGGAALWTGQLAADYAPDVNLIGVAALAPVSNPTAFVANLGDTIGGSVFAAYALTGYAAEYPDVHFDDYVRPEARTVVHELAQRCLGEPAFLLSILESITTKMDVFSTDLLTGPLGQRLAENVPTGPFGVPVLVAQGATDPLVLPGPQADYADQLCASDVDVDYRSYEGRDHVGLVATDSPLIAELIAWTQQRLDGEPSTSTCGA